MYKVPMKAVSRISALALIMIACGGGGGGGGTTTPPVTNTPPTAPTINVLTTNPLTLHPFMVRLNANDAEGDSITYLVNGNSISGNTYSVTPASPGMLSLTVVAMDSKGASSVPTPYSTNVLPNHAPVITSSQSFSMSSATASFDQSVQVTATDADGDDVILSFNGTPTFTNERSESVSGAFLTLTSQVGGASLRFQGTVPAGSSVVTAHAALVATDKVPGTSTIVGATGTQNLSITYSNTANNHAPSAPVIVGPTTVISLHPAFYNLSSVDPEGDAITFLVNGTAIAGTTYSLIATSAGPTVLTVVARDSKGASSPASTLTVNVAANRAPQFITSANPAPFTGASSSFSVSYNVAAQDPDTDDVKFDPLSGITVLDSNGAPVAGAAPVINSTTGLVTWSGTVPGSASSVTATFTVTARDYLPANNTALGASSTQVVRLIYNKI